MCHLLLFSVIYFVGTVSKIRIVEIIADYLTTKKFVS